MSGLAQLIGALIQIYMVIIIVNVILSWVIHGSRNMAVRRVYWITNQLVDPALAPIRQILSPMTRNFGIDISPLILIILLQFIQAMLG